MSSEVLGPDTNNSSAAIIPPTTDSGAAVKVRVGRDEGEDVLKNLIWENINAHHHLTLLINIITWRFAPEICFGFRYGT